jgi:hypothetical protein
MVVAAMTFDGALMTLRIKEDFGPFELEAAVADVPAFSEEFAVSPNANPPRQCAAHPAAFFQRPKIKANAADCRLIAPVDRPPLQPVGDRS